MNETNTQKEYDKTICDACLSVGRKLFPLGQYSDVYSRICLNSYKTGYQLICWECIAFLKKAKQFVENVKISQRTLAYYCSSRQMVPKSLSNLQINHTNIESILNIVHEEIDDKRIQHIKEEKDADFDNYDFNDNTNDYDNDFIKEDLKNEAPSDFELKKGDPKTDIKNETCDISVKKNKSRIPKQYKYVYDKINKEDLQRLTKKIVIELSSVACWLERERDSDVFKNANFKCNMCAFSWKTEKALLEHNKKYHDLESGPITCDLCKCRFSNKKQLARHLKRHMYVRECVKCRHKGCVLRHMALHLKEHTRKLQCVACGSTGFFNTRQLYRHYKELHRVFICDHCSKKCKSKRTIEKHMRRHLANYHCKVCDKRYKTSATYRKHCNARHRSSGEDAYCVQCDKRFSSATLYRRHVASSRAHAPERDGQRTEHKVPCPTCGRVYSRKTYMMNHYLYVHMNQSKYHCETCDRHFLNRTRYVEHVKSKHEGVKKEKNKLCNICGRGFAANRTLINHIRTHSGERPFECTHCDSKFTQKYAMLTHVRHVHNRKRTWQ